MQALVLNGPREFSLTELVSPAVNEGQVLLEVQVAGIGGSEYLGYNNPGIRPLPNIMGHGFTGTIADGTRVAVNPLSGCGKCRYCLDGLSQLCEQWSLIGVQTNGGFAQKVAVPSERILPLPDMLSWEQSAFIEPFANSINAWQLSGAAADNSIAIIGAGSLGLGLAAQASELACDDVHVAELSPVRRSAAQSLLAGEVSEQLAGEYDIVFETVGSQESRRQAIDLTRKGGKCVFLGFQTPEQTLNIAQLIRDQKTLIGSFVYSMEQFQQAVNLAQHCDDTWVKNVSFKEVESILMAFLEGHFDWVKVALRPND